MSVTPGSAEGHDQTLRAMEVPHAGGEDRDARRSLLRPRISGCFIFKGYFFRRPEVMVTHEIPLTA